MSASVAAASSRVFLTVHGINGDEGAGEAEFGEQGLHRRNFVRLLVTVEMRQHQRCIRRERAQNMCGLASWKWLKLRRNALPSMATWRCHSSPACAWRTAACGRKTCSTHAGANFWRMKRIVL